MYIIPFFYGVLPAPDFDRAAWAREHNCERYLTEYTRDANGQWYCSRTFANAR